MLRYAMLRDATRRDATRRYARYVMLDCTPDAKTGTFFSSAGKGRDRRQVTAAAVTPARFSDATHGPSPHATSRGSQDADALAVLLKTRPFQERLRQVVISISTSRRDHIAPAPP